MKFENLEIRTNPFKKSPPRKKDGLHQLKIRVFIGSNDQGRFRNRITLEIKVVDESSKQVFVSANEFDNRKTNKKLNLIILKTESKISDTVIKMIEGNVKLTSANLFKYLYNNIKANKAGEVGDTEKTIWNDEVNKFYDGPVPVSVWEKFRLAVIEDETENITEEEMQNIAESVYFDHVRNKETRRISSMNYNERYKTGNFNKSNIFELFGFCWSDNPKNGEPLITGSYRSLIVQLNDYRFNAKPSESVKYFNDAWITNFLKYLINKGYPLVHIRGYDPFTIAKYRERFIKAERIPYNEVSFQKLVKHLKRHIDILQKFDMIPYTKNTKLIQASDFLKRKAKNQIYTRRDHSLTVKEFDLIADTDFNDKNLNLARDMFIIAVLGGGFRTLELYNDHLYIQDNRLNIYRKKTNDRSINPIILQLNDVIKRHNGFPEFLKVEEFRSCLKTIAKKVPLDRVKRKLKDQEQDLILKYEQKLTEKLQQEAEVIQKRESDRVELRLKEREELIGSLTKQVEEMRRKAKQGSMQMQGEVQELAIEEILRGLFPMDLIEEIGKGIKGADTIHIVRNKIGIDYGKILYESKRTKVFVQEWISKLKADALTVKADLLVIITEALPDGIEKIGQKDGVWICTYNDFKGLVIVLRESLIKISEAYSSQTNKGEKMQMLYDYLTSNEFLLQVSAIVEGFSSLQDSYIREKRAMERIWKEREKQLEKVLLNTNHFIGSIKGIAGTSIPQLKEIGSEGNILELPSSDI